LPSVFLKIEVLCSFAFFHLFDKIKARAERRGGYWLAETFKNWINGALSMSDEPKNQQDEPKLQDATDDRQREGKTLSRRMSILWTIAALGAAVLAAFGFRSLKNSCSYQPTGDAPAPKTTKGAPPREPEDETEEEAEAEVP
jgi:hypothetical protein